jgi:hypothetical protein
MKVRKDRRGQVTILIRKGRKAVDHKREFLEDESDSGVDEDEVWRATAKGCIALIVGLCAASVT